MKDNAITLGNVAAKFTMLEIAYRRCERRGWLQVDRLIEQHGADMGLPELGDILRSNCPKRESVSTSERCSLYYPQLLRLWERTGTRCASMKKARRRIPAGVSESYRPARDTDRVLTLSRQHYQRQPGYRAAAVLISRPGAL